MSTIFEKTKLPSFFLETYLGQAFVESERKEIEPLIRTLFGYYLLLLGEEAFLSCVEKSPTQHHIGIQPTRIANDHFFVGRQDKLPIQSSSVDVIYLPHCLEFMINPHEVLRESYRALVPEGYLIISCFNPWSLWGIRRRFFSFRKKTPWNGHFISVLRLKDWLALLGFDIIQQTPFFFRPPINHAGLLKYLKWLEIIGRWCWPFGSGAYLILARKRVMTLTPIKPAFRMKRKTVPGTVSVATELSQDTDSGM